MNTLEFRWRLSDDEIIDAIRRAERKTSGEIRVYISDSKIDDPLAAAQSRFVEMGMTQTRQRNGVLIFIAPSSQVFAIIGDEGIHARCGDDFWREVSDEFRRSLRADAATEGIVHAVTRTGELLSRHFPRLANDQNELPDRPEHGP